MTPHTLTPAEIMDLRVSCRTLRNIGGGLNAGFPYILYIPSDEVFCVCFNGSPQAKHFDPRVLGALLSGERAEPGYIKRILSANEPCDIAAASPRMRSTYHTTHAQREAEEAHAASLRRLAAFNPAAISLEDLL